MEYQRFAHIQDKSDLVCWNQTGENLSIGRNHGKATNRMTRYQVKRQNGEST